ncbi:Reverse transcriptase domain [Trinorchestia longiramus]|nr:Reverse transcriptase domain [Trinorchestia longiramus]
MSGLGLRVLYKLGSCGVRGPILRWLHSYLTNRSFQVYFQGSYSSVRGTRSGVPQGGILSPMLFNLMILVQLPLNVATSELVQRLDTPQIGSSSLLPTFIVSVRAIFPKVNLPTPSGNAAPIISPLPPWFRTDDCILTEFLPSSVSSLTSQSVIQTYNELMDTKFADYIAVFTDGSQITEPTCSASAAVVVPPKGVTLNWETRSQNQVIV